MIKHALIHTGSGNISEEKIIRTVYFKKSLNKKNHLLVLFGKLNLEFKNMIARKKGAQFFSCCEKASPFPYLINIVQVIRQDFDAAYQVMASIWSKGKTDKQFEKFKKKKGRKSHFRAVAHPDFWEYQAGIHLK